jgi:hypothetical protein
MTPSHNNENSVPPVATAATAGYIDGRQGSTDVRFPVSVVGTTLLNLTAATHIDDPTGGETEDAEARAAIALILDALEVAGIVAAA